MTQAAENFVGMKDFKSFTAIETEEQSTKVLIDECTLQTTGDLLVIRITGSHFIWKMVRQIVGILVEVGRGKMQPADIERFFQTQSDRPAKVTAPPSGLFLERVYYKGDRKNTAIKPVLPVPTKQELGIYIQIATQKKRSYHDNQK